MLRLNDLVVEAREKWRDVVGRHAYGPLFRLASEGARKTLWLDENGKHWSHEAHLMHIAALMRMIRRLTAFLPPSAVLKSDSGDEYTVDALRDYCRRWIMGQPTERRDPMISPVSRASVREAMGLASGQVRAETAEARAASLRSSVGALLAGLPRGSKVLVRGSSGEEHLGPAEALQRLSGDYSSAVVSVRIPADGARVRARVLGALDGLQSQIPTGGRKARRDA